MREVKPETFQVFRLDELEPQARERAIETIREKLSGDWWETNDTESISDVIVFKLAHELGVPGVEKWGEGDFPGIDGVELQGWDLERGEYLELRGHLNRQNAPALPWADGLVEVTLNAARRYTSIDVETNEDALDPHQERDLTVVREQCQELAGTMEDAIAQAIGAAITAGREALEYLSSEERAVEDIEANEREFRADGSLF